MLPALLDSTNNQVVCGPEAILLYIILVKAKKPEILRCSCDAQEVHMMEIRSMMVEWCYGLMHLSSITKDTLVGMVNKGVTQRLQRIENILAKDNRNTVMCTKDYTLADIMVFDFVMFFEKVVPGSTKSLSKCNALVSNIKQIPQVAKFVQRDDYLKGIESFTPDVCMYVWGLDVPTSK